MPGAQATSGGSGRARRTHVTCDEGGSGIWRNRSRSSAQLKRREARHFLIPREAATEEFFRVFTLPSTDGRCPRLHVQPLLVLGDNQSQREQRLLKWRRWPPAYWVAGLRTSVSARRSLIHIDEARLLLDGRPTATENGALSLRSRGNAWPVEDGVARMKSMGDAARSTICPATPE